MSFMPMRLSEDVNMLDINDPKIRSLLLRFDFGLEKEALRITKDGSLSKTPHPFPDDKTVVRDFCENQTEINTGVHDSEEGALEELEQHEKKVRQTLLNLPQPEYLWPFSNPPYIKDEDDIPIANFTGPLYDKTVYRDYLAKMYGKYKMTFSGIHVNLSFAEELIDRHIELTGTSKSRREVKDDIYLDLAKNLVRDGWIINVLLSASPVLDGSFLERGVKGRTEFLGMASVRCSELGYWNHFVPVFNYQSVSAYADGIRNYISEGLITSQTEIYYPVRLKPKGANSLETLVEKGVNHIELRNVDLNPYAYAGLDIRDLKFIKLLTAYELCQEPHDMTRERQIKSVINFKNSAHYNIETDRIMNADDEFVPIKDASVALIDRIWAFYEAAGLLDDEAKGILSYQKDKLVTPGRRYAERVYDEYKDDFFARGLKTSQNLP